MEVQTTGAQRAAMRLAAKREANKAIPTIPREPSRQVKRAQKRRAEKQLRQHMNEHVGGKNRKKTSGDRKKAAA